MNSNNSLISSNCKFLRLLYYNARSLLPKFDNLLSLVHVHNPHIICIVESWLSSVVSDSEICVPHFQLFRFDRNRHGGGVLIYVSNELSVSPLPSPPPSLELLPLSLSSHNFKLHLCLFYRPPSSPSTIFDTLFTYFQSIDAGHFSNFIFVGDFNVNFDNPSHPLYSNLCNVMSLFSLSQSVVGPTHVQNNTSSTIDLVFVSNPSLVSECSTIPPLSNSDHLGILLDLKKKLKPSDKCQGRLIWRYSHADWDKACDLIESFDWDSILTDDIDASLKQWHKQFMDIMAQSIPNRFLPPRRNLPWLTKPIIQSMRKRNILFKNAKLSGNFAKYKRARNRTASLLKLAKKKYFCSLNPKDSKKFWKAVKSLNKSKQSIPTLYHDDVVACDDADKANLLCSFFSSCFNQSCALISPSPNHPLRFSFPDDLLCNESEVFDLLATLDTTTANGQDGISARMLKSVAASITPSLTKLFNVSLMTGCIPTQWKKSMVVPIPKNSNTSSPTNYRPISLLPIVSKLLERHVYSVILSHLETHYPLSSVQWGFLKGRSTVTALLHCTNEWLKALEDGKEVCAIFFDFRKAFDSVPHSPLMAKLHSLGLNEYILRWLNNYLSNRVQSVIVNGSESAPAEVLSGVPQGSVLGPLLFLIYIDDLPSVLHNLGPEVNLFADDVLLYHVISKEEDFALVQEAVSLLDNWSAHNHLNFNLTKCKFMIISRKLHPTLPTTPLLLSNHPLQRVFCYKYLGLLLTDNLSWSQHILSCCSKARQVLGLLYRRFYSFSNQETLKQLYLSLVRPHIEYGCQVWDPHLAKDKKALEGVQKFGLRLASHRWDASYNELLDLFDLPSHEDRRLHLKLGLLFKIVHGLCYYPDVPLFRDQSYSYRSNHSYQLVCPTARTNAYHFSFFPHTISNWNALDCGSVSASKYSSFMRLLS